MAARNKKIQLAFFNSTLNEAESKQAEFTGMVILASDFIKSGKVKGAEDLERISKISIPIYLSKTKTGKYVALNPSGLTPVKVPLIQLPSREEITSFVSDPNNLDLEKLYKMMLKFKVEEAELKGGYNAKQLRAMEDVLRAPRDNRPDFKPLTPTGDMDELKTQLGLINNLVYDSPSLDKAITERMKIIEAALTEESKEYSLKFDERSKFWKAEITNASTNLKKRLKERDNELETETKTLEAKTLKKIKDNMKMFLQGVAKNMRTDEVPIEKLIVEVETLAKKAPSRENIPKITDALEKMKDNTNILLADIEFQNRKIRELSAKEQNFLEIQELDVMGLKNRCERDKAILVEDSKQLEKKRDAEIKLLKADREAAKQRLAQFKDKKDNWKSDIRESLGGRATPMISASLLNMESPPALIEVHIPLYIFQYRNRKNDNLYTIAVPPIRLPNTMKSGEKGSFSGDHKTVFFNPVVPSLQKLVVNWFEEAASDLDIATKILAMDNLLDRPEVIRNEFFESNNLMLNKLRVNKKKLSSANERLTTAFSTN